MKTALSRDESKEKKERDHGHMHRVRNAKMRVAVIEPKYDAEE